MLVFWLARQARLCYEPATDKTKKVLEVLRPIQGGNEVHLGKGPAHNRSYGNNVTASRVAPTEEAASYSCHRFIVMNYGWHSSICVYGMNLSMRRSC